MARASTSFLPLFRIAASSAAAAVPSGGQEYGAAFPPRAAEVGPAMPENPYAQGYGYEAYYQQETMGHYPGSGAQQPEYGYPTADSAEALQQQLGVRDPVVGWREEEERREKERNWKKRRRRRGWEEGRKGGSNYLEYFLIPHLHLQPILLFVCFSTPFLSHIIHALLFTLLL